MLRFNHGFSVVEVSIVIIVTSFLLLNLIPRGYRCIQQAHYQARQNKLETLAQLSKVYLAKNGFWPKTVLDVADNISLNYLDGVNLIIQGRYLIVQEKDQQAIAYAY